MRNACQCRSGGSSVDDHAGATREYRCTAVYTAVQGRWPNGPAGTTKGGRPPADRHHHSRPRARARVTMRTRIMRARARARARARGDTPWICSRIINGVEDYRRAVLGSSKNQPAHSGVYRGIPLYSRVQPYTRLYSRVQPCTAVHTCIHGNSAVHQ